MSRPSFPVREPKNRNRVTFKMALKSIRRDIFNSVRARDRTNKSFALVIMFIIVFGIIILTELIMVDTRTEPARGTGKVLDYEEIRDDYLLERDGGKILDNIFQEEIARHLPRPLNTSEGDRWQPVDGTRHKFYVYSAYYEHRFPSPFVVVIAATKTVQPDRVMCRFSLPGNRWLNVYAKVKAIKENWGLKYSATFVSCPLNSSRRMEKPTGVSVVSGARAIATNFMHIHDTNTSLTMKAFGVCVKPLHYGYEHPNWLLEWLEMYRILGAESFTFYNHSVGNSTDCILRQYVKENLVDIHPWHLNMTSQKEIRTEGIFAALNDCLYRTMSTMSLVAFVDLDEVIMPREADTLPQLISAIRRTFPTHPSAAYSFRNSFFYLTWPDDTTTPQETRHLLTQHKTRRAKLLHEHKHRSKYICDPRRAVEIGNHFVWDFTKGSGTYKVSPDDAILNHYRVCEQGGNDCIKTAAVVDRTAQRFGARLAARVQERHASLAERCRLPPLDGKRLLP